MRYGWIAAAAWLLLPGAPASAQGQPALYARSLAASCAACHGTDGRTTEGSSVPALAGMPRDYMAAQLRAFKTGSRPATVMHQLSKGFSETQIDVLAGYFAAQQK